MTVSCLSGRWVPVLTGAATRSVASPSMPRRRTDTDMAHARPQHPDVAVAGISDSAKRVIARAATRASFDSWDTDRTGNPGWMMDGWQITSHRDPVELVHWYSQHAGNPEFKIARIAPIDPNWIERRHRELGLAKMAVFMPDDTAAIRGAEMREAIVVAIANGSTVTKALATCGVAANTYSKWRGRFPDFALKVEGAKHQREMAKGGSRDPAGNRPDFAEFRRHYFGYETYEHHARIIEAIESTPPGGFTMILVPPEAGKTTLLEDYLCYQIALDPNHRILLVTEAGTQGQAQKMLSTVKERLTDPDATNPDAQYPLHIREFLARYGPFHEAQEDKDKPWNANYIKVHRASGRRDYSLQCAGWRSKVYGSRCDTLLFDDVQSTDSVNLTDNILGRMRGTFFSRVNQRGKTIYIGTRNAVGDVPEKLIASGAVDNVVIIPALDSDGRSYCPEMWPDEALAQKRRLVLEPAWWCNYMQDPRQAENPTFERGLLEEARDGSQRVGKVPADRMVALSLDPALGGFCALTAAAWTPETFQVVDFREEPGLSRNEQIFDMVADFARRYGPGEVIVEINSLQRGLARDDRMRDMEKTFGFRIVEVETNQNKWDVMFGVAAMAGSFIRREMILPDEEGEGAFSRRTLEPLLNQLEQWRPNVPTKLLRQDGVMSLYFNWRRWMEWREAGRVDAAMWQAAGTPWDQAGKGAPWGDSLSVFGTPR